MLTLVRGWRRRALGSTRRLGGHGTRAACRRRVRRVAGSLAAVAYPARVADRGTSSSWLGGGRGPPVRRRRATAGAARAAGVRLRARWRRSGAGSRALAIDWLACLLISAAFFARRARRVPAQPGQPDGDARDLRAGERAAGRLDRRTRSGTGCSRLRAARPRRRGAAPAADRAGRRRVGADGAGPASARWCAPCCCAWWSPRSCGTADGRGLHDRVAGGPADRAARRR